MIYKVKEQLTEHGINLIPVPSEKLRFKACYYHELEVEGVAYTILDRVSCHKDGLIPSSLLYLSLGKVIDSDKVWKHYNKSEYLHFFIVEKK